MSPVVFVGSSLSDLKALPDPVQDHFGYALYTAQCGAKHRDAKPLTGFGGSGVLGACRDEKIRYVESTTYGQSAVSFGL